MKKILQISKYYYPEVGGIEKISKAFSDAVFGSIEMRVICFTREKEDNIDYIDGVQIVRCGTKKKILSQPISLSIIGKLRKILKEYKPNYVILHEPNPYLSIFTKYLINKNTQLILYWHSDIIKQKIGEKILRKHYFKILRRADKVIATSENYVKGSIYLSKVRDKCIIIPNCIDEEQLSITAKSHMLSKKIRDEFHGKIICVGVGRVVPYKGFELLAQVSKIVGEKFVFFISGRPGISTPIIENIIEKNNNFILLGETSDEIQKGYLEAADIFVFPSITKNEAFGIALAEGMYFGKPAITYTIPGSGVNYVNIDKFTGIEVTNGSIKEYAKALQVLGDSNELRNVYGKNAKERVDSMFTLSIYKNNIIKLLQEELK